MKLLTKILTITAVVAPNVWAMTQTPQGAFAADDIRLDSVTSGGRVGHKVELPEGAKIPKPMSDEDRKYPTHLLTRSYGDSIVLRWAYDNYAIWQLAKNGKVDILRYDESEGGRLDTVARNIRAYTLKEMEAAFPASDSLAGVAAQAMYGKSAKLTDYRNEGFGFNPIAEVYNQQQTMYAYALLAAEWRADLAKALGLRFTDRNVVPGHEYRYAIQPNISDSIMKVLPGVALVVNEPFVKPKFTAAITDSIYPNGELVRLQWPHDGKFSAYDVERRFNGGAWTPLNTVPSMSLSTDYYQNPLYDYYTDTDVQQLGTYDYRVRGYDAFGDKSDWSATVSVTLTDNTPPTPPRISLFSVRREGPNKERAFVTIHWEKTEIEPDMAGYNVYYYHEQNGGVWTRLNDKMLAPTDTTFTTEVVAISGGFVSVSTVDKNGNEGASIPQEIDMEDYTPPAKPTGLKHVMLPTGVVILRWNDNKEPDLKGYMVYSANDTTHQFMPISKAVQRDTIAFDTIQVKNINQRYIYYRIKAIDYAGNSSEMSDIYQVTRANFDKPGTCIPDTVWIDNEYINIDWQTHGEHTTREYRVFRKKAIDSNWTLVSTISADSVKNYVLHTVDNPPYDRQNKYFYTIQGIGLMGIPGDMSHPLPVWHKGPRFLDVNLTLTGTVSKNGNAVLDWTFSEDAPEGYFFQIEAPDGTGGWHKLITLDGSSRHNERFTIDKNNSRSFRIRMLWRDGLTSKPSETITLTNTGLETL